MSTDRFFGTAQIDSDIRNVLILSPYLQTSENAVAAEIDFDSSLIVDLDVISHDVAEQLKSMAQNPIADNSKLLIEYLGTKSFRNSDKVLHWLQTTNNILKVESSKVSIRMGNGANVSLSDINKMIRDDMIKSDQGIDIDQYHKNKAKENARQLNETMYPDFNNPSERGEVAVTPIDEVAQPMDIPEIVPSEHFVTATESSSDVKHLHSDMISEIQKMEVNLNEAMTTMKSFENTLSTDVVNSMVNTLKEYGSHTTESVKDTVIDMLATHYEHVDKDYIKKNLEAAEKRLSKKA